MGTSGFSFSLFGSIHSFFLFIGFSVICEAGTDLNASLTPSSCTLSDLTDNCALFSDDAPPFYPYNGDTIIPNWSFIADDAELESEPSRTLAEALFAFSILDTVTPSLDPDFKYSFANNIHFIAQMILGIKDRSIYLPWPPFGAFLGVGFKE